MTRSTWWVPMQMGNVSVQWVSAMVASFPGGAGVWRHSPRRAGGWGVVRRWGVRETTRRRGWGPLLRGTGGGQGVWARGAPFVGGGGVGEEGRDPTLLAPRGQ